jgi:hypothetical protein
MFFQLIARHRPGDAVRLGDGIAVIARRMQRGFRKNRTFFSPLQDKRRPIRLIPYQMNSPAANNVNGSHGIPDPEDSRSGSEIHIASRQIAEKGE